MSPGAIVLLSLVVLLLALILLESRRQVRKYGKGSGRGTAHTMVRAGMLETQRLLQPERKVEVLQEQDRKEVEEDRPEAGDGR